MTYIVQSSPDAYPVMSADVKAEWLERLHDSNPVQPGANWLRSVREGVVHQTPLGVLCEIAHEHGVVHRTAGNMDDMGTVIHYYGQWPQVSLAPREVLEWANLSARGSRVAGVTLDYFRTGGQYDLVSLTKAGARWSEIINIIEVQL